MRKIIISVLLPAVLAVAPFGETATSGPFAAVASLYELARLELIEDSTEGVPQLGRAIAFELRELQADFSAHQAGVSGDRAEALRSALPAMIKSAESLANASRLEEARLAFYALSKNLVRWRAGVTDDQKLPFDLLSHDRLCITIYP